MEKRTREICDELFDRIPALEPCRESVEGAYELMRDCYARDGKVLVCGNGGSAADSEHIVGELMKGFRMKRPLSSERRGRLESSFGEEGVSIADGLQGALPAISLVSHSSLSTAFANDVAPDLVFAQQVFGYGNPGDLLIAISTSGRSSNVIKAAKTALAFDLTTIALTGEASSPLSKLCSVSVRVPARETHEVQEYHLMIYHALCAMVESEFFER